MNEEYRRLIEEAQNKKIVLTEQNGKALKKLYIEVAEDLIKQASKSKGFSKAWLNDYSKAVRNRLGELENDIATLNKEALKTSSEIAAGVHANFFQHIGETYELDIPLDVAKSFYTIPEDVVLKMLSGELYKDGKGLSSRIWGISNKTGKDINYILAKGMAEQKPYKDLIKDLERYVDPAAQKPWQWKKVYPTVSKQVDYNAQRLLRTGINHAFYISSMESNKKNPFVEAIHWQLSSEHYERQIKRFGEDVCDGYTKQNDYGLGEGNYPKDKVPVPHPMCLCSQYAVIPESMDDIAKELGDWINGKSNSKLDQWYASVA